jgi:hypothetical protein
MGVAVIGVVDPLRLMTDSNSDDVDVDSGNPSDGFDNSFAGRWGRQGMTSCFGAAGRIGKHTEHSRDFESNWVVFHGAPVFYCPEAFYDRKILSTTKIPIKMARF